MYRSSLSKVLNRAARVVARLDGLADVEGNGAVADSIDLLHGNTVDQFKIRQHVGCVDDGVAGDAGLQAGVHEFAIKRISAANWAVW